MPISPDHHNLFQSSGALDKLNLFQSLLDAGTLTTDEALALLNSIHTELERPEGHNRAVYTQYALVMESLRTKMPNMYQDISVKWQQLHSVLQTQVDHEAAAEDNEPIRKNQTVASLLSKLPQKNVGKKGIDQRSGGKNDSEEIEVELKEEMEGEESEEEETEEKEETEKGEGEEKEKEETEEEDEKEEDEEKEEEKEEGEEDDEKEEDEKEEDEEEKEETEEEDEKEEGEEEKDETEKEDKKEESKNESSARENVGEERNSREEVDRMATEGAEAAEESEHVEVETEVEPFEIETPIQPPIEEETDAGFGGEAEPPMEMPEA